MADRYAGVGGRDSVDAPASSAFVITKSDDTVFSQPTRAVWVGGTGDLAVKMVDETTLTFTAVPAGVLLPIRVQKVLSTGTTATNIVGLY